MDTVISTILICAPLAFLAGWLISKVILKQGLTKQAKLADNPETPKNFDPTATIQRPDGRNVLAMALEETRKNRDENRAKTGTPGEDFMSTSVHNELLLLKEALAERDHQITELKANLQDQPDQLALHAAAGKNDQQPGMATDNLSENANTDPYDTNAFHINKDNSNRDNIDQDEQLAAAEHEKLLLTGQVHRAEALADKKSRHVSTWRGRARALIKQCRQQRMIIGELRNQLRQLNDTADSADLPPELPATVDVPADDLKVLRGIGPALEKRLNKQGIFCYRQIAAMTADDLIEVGQSLGIGKLRKLSAEWLEQAQALVQATQPEAGIEIGAENQAGTDSTTESATDSSTEQDSAADSEILPA